MKRDMDLARKILLEVEKAPERGERIDIRIEGYTEDEIEDGLLLLEEGGLVVLGQVYINEDYHKPTGLTLEGQKFLDAARDNSIWKKAKDIAAKTGSTAFPVVLRILLELGKTEAMKYLPK